MIFCVKKVTYQARGRKKVQTMVITGEEKHGCDVNEDIVIKAHIRVPAIPPTDHTASNMIKVHYYCRVRIMFFFEFNKTQLR